MKITIKQEQRPRLFGTTPGMSILRTAKTMKNFLVLSLCAALAAGFTACNDDDPAANAGVDAYVISKYINTEGEPEIVYGLSLISVVNKSLTSATVTFPNSETQALTISSYSATFETKEEDYTTYAPAVGTYKFSFVFSSGEVYETSNSLSSSSAIDPAVITKYQYSDNKIQLEWDDADNTGSYRVEMADDDETVYGYGFHASNILDGSWNIKSSNGTWLSGHPQTGKTYTVKVLGLKLESNDYYDGFSIASKTVVWGAQ